MCNLHKGARMVLPIIAVATVALTGCSDSTENSAAEAPPPGATPGPSSSGIGETPASVPSATRIVLELDDGELGGELDDSPASASLIAQLPLTLSFRDYGGQEKIAELPAPLDLTGAPKGSDAAPLTIGYYVPDRGLILYYDQVGYFTGIVPLGSFENLDPIVNRTTEFTVTIRRADGL